MRRTYKRPIRRKTPAIKTGEGMKVSMPFNPPLLFLCELNGSGFFSYEKNYFNLASSFSKRCFKSLFSFSRAVTRASSSLIELITA